MHNRLTEYGLSFIEAPCHDCGEPLLIDPEDFVHSRLALDGSFGFFLCVRCHCRRKNERVTDMERPT